MHGALPADFVTPTLEGLVSQLRAAGRSAEIPATLDRVAKAYPRAPDVLQAVATHREALR